MFYNLTVIHITASGIFITTILIVNALIQK